MAPLTAGVAAIRDPSERIGRDHVREGKGGFTEEMVLSVALGPTRLREAIIHAQAVAGANPLEHSVENDPAIFRLVEPEMGEVIEGTSGLRNDLGVNPPHIAGERIGRAVIIPTLVAKPGVEIADCSETQ